IRFVLNDDDFSSLAKETRQALLHEGTGPATISAYVEMVFDNSDNRFPTGKDEVVLRRTIGLKKDEFSLDKKTVSKGDVMNLLESAGFSRSNPYYIVPQGRITALTNAKDGTRLALLKEVAGTRVYEERRKESLKIMDETELKRSKINELLEYIEERLNELEEEKEELKQFQDLDRERRCLEYAIYSREQQDTNQQLEDLEMNRRAEVDGANQRQDRLLDRERQISDIEREIEVQRRKIDLLKTEKQQIDEDREEQMKAKTHLELLVADLENATAAENDIKQKLIAELKKVQTDIDHKQSELARIDPMFQRWESQQSALQKQLIDLEHEQNLLFQKQGRNDRFRSQRERDAWLEKECTSLRKLVEDHERTVADLERELREARERMEASRVEMERMRKGLEGGRKDVEEYEAIIRQAREERITLDETRKKLWREDSTLSQAREQHQTDLNQAERALFQSVDRNTIAGVQAAMRIGGRMEGVYGPLYELFDVDERYQTAVDKVVGTSLFHIVVNNDETVTRILDVMNRERSGRATFMPLNRLHPKPVTRPNTNGQKDAIPMVDKLRYDPTHEKAFVQIFGKVVICPNLEVASIYARTQGVNAVTLDGDRADRKGALTGGYIDIRRTRLEAVRNIKRCKAELARITTRSGEVAREIQHYEQKITEVRNRIADAEKKRDEILRGREEVVGRLSAGGRDIEAMVDTIAQKERLLEENQTTIRQYKQQLQSHEGDLSTPFTRDLSADEQSRLDELTGIIDKIRSDFLLTSKSCTEYKSQKMVIEIELNENLLKRRD
ncbi:Structural maintenance of chromosomes protein 3, partial [Quaeritorhiza haematococci]